MGLCRDCRWWQAIDYGDGNCLRLGVYTRGDKQRLSLSSPKSANVITGELFGCNQFVPREGGDGE